MSPVQKQSKYKLKLVEIGGICLVQMPKTVTVQMVGAATAAKLEVIHTSDE